MTSYERGQKLLRGDYSSYTPTGSSYFKRYNHWRRDPHEGDIVYFYTSSLGRISHVGIVSAAQYANGVWLIDTIEGNTNAGVNFERDGGCVALKHYDFLPSQVGGTNRIAGFGIPDFCADTCSAQQLISIARSQIGYVEKASNKDLQDFRANPGDGNWTKYGQWYGLNPAQWCQMFVSWCAYMACVSAHDYKPGWFKDSGFWTYRKANGDWCRDEWLFDGGRWYVFDGSGHMVTGWFYQQDGWYYLADDGGMCASQWVNDRGHSYYMTSSGVMATNAYIRAEMPISPGVYLYYWVNGKGEWQPQWDTEYPDLEQYEIAK